MARQPQSSHPLPRTTQENVSLIFDDSDLPNGATSYPDGLVISCNIANMEIKRVYVDDGSAVEIMYTSCFYKLGIDNAKLKPATLPLVDFANHAVAPIGVITLPVIVGKHPLQKILNCNFTVVDAPGAFNVILGRP